MSLEEDASDLFSQGVQVEVVPPGEDPGAEDNPTFPAAMVYVGDVDGREVVALLHLYEEKASRLSVLDYRDTSASTRELDVEGDELGEVYTYRLSPNVTDDARAVVKSIDSSYFDPESFR